MNYTVNSGQNIFDVVINTITDFNSIYSFLQSNNIPNITTSPLGYEITYEPPAITPPTIVSQQMSEVVTSKTFSSIPNQSVYDIVLQTYGDLNQTYKLIQDSNFSNLLTYPLPQTLFNFNPTLVNDAVFASYLSKNGIVINTIFNNATVPPNNNLQTADGVDIQDADGNQLEVA